MIDKLRQVADKSQGGVRLPPSAFVQGTVTDSNDHLAVAGATVRALQDGTVVRQTTTTNAAGFYRMQLRLGTYRYRADDLVFFVLVTDGQLNLRFVERNGFDQPVVNAIRIRERPDR